VIEMERPKQQIDSKAASQIRDYAFAVSDDERFRDSKTRWTFRREAKEQLRPEGLVVKRTPATGAGAKRCSGREIEGGEPTW
jgi:hypothetical protein